MTRPPSEVRVDLGAVAHNVRVLRAAAPRSEIMAVVKADGYNHGAVEVSRAALAAGAAEIGVTTVDEALELRRAGIGAPILAWLHGVDTDFEPAIEQGIEIGVSSSSQLAVVAKAAITCGSPATVALKVDTGLTRNGVSAHDLPAALDAALTAERGGAIVVRSIFSHLACADDPEHPSIDRQKARFDAIVADARARGLNPERLHLANSAAALTRPDLHYDVVRTGIAVYGLSPAPHLGTFGLRPAMTLTARVALIKSVAAGDGVSYGHVWSAPRDGVVALLPVGYADGIVRGLTGRFHVAIGGVRYPVVGRVCMDQVMVDLGSNVHGVTEGDDAFFFGPGTHGEPHAGHWAEALDTITYEVVTGIRGRIARTYVEGTQ